MITTVAGTGTSGFSGDHGPAADAMIGYINGLAVNIAGDLFMAEHDYHCIRKVSGDSHIITTIIGVCDPNNYGYVGENVTATIAKLNGPVGVAVNNGEIVIADTFNHRIRGVTTDGMIHTIVGNGVAGFSGVSGIAIDAKLNPTSTAVTNNGEIIISDSANQKIRKVDRNGIITSIAGNGMKGFGGDGASALTALLNGPRDVVVTDTGDVLFADAGNNRIRKVFSNGTIVTIAGNGNVGFSGDGVLATDTALNQPRSIAYWNGEVYIADTGNHRIRKILNNGTITTIAGNGTDGYCGDNGSAIEVCVNRPVSVVVNNAGEVFISDEDNHIVRKIDQNGIISTFAGTPESWGYSGDIGSATMAQLAFPRGLAINSEGELLIADTDNFAIRKVDKNGIISTVADEFSYPPVDIAVGQDEEFFTSIGGDHVAKIDTNGLKITVAGSGAYPGDFYLPDNVPLAFVSSVSVLSDTELIVTDTYNQVATMGQISHWCLSVHCSRCHSHTRGDHWHDHCDKSVHQTVHHRKSCHQG